MNDWLSPPEVTRIREMLQPEPFDEVVWNRRLEPSQDPLFRLQIIHVWSTHEPSQLRQVVRLLDRGILKPTDLYGTRADRFPAIFLWDWLGWLVHVFVQYDGGEDRLARFLVEPKSRVAVESACLLGAHPLSIVGQGLSSQALPLLLRLGSGLSFRIDAIGYDP